MNLSPTTTSVSNQQLNQVLQTHQNLVAMTALGGPAVWSADKFPTVAAARLAEDYKKFMESIQLQQNGKDFSRPLPFDFKFSGTGSGRLPIQPTPFLLTADTHSVQCDVKLEGVSIPCFEIGGEKRLCLPQILKTVWVAFPLDIINDACDALHIFCSRCNPEQLAAFKRNDNLPVAAGTCGLITMTDAERLCSILLHGSTIDSVPKDHGVKRHANESCIPVYHECFGEGFGYLKSDLYSSPDAKCIECMECRQHLSTKQFVGHCHSSQEQRVCHWGFDRNNWRSYLMIDTDSLDNAECSRFEFAFNDIISRFTDVKIASPTRKRKESESSSCSPHPLSPASGSPQSSKARRLTSSVSTASPTADSGRQNRPTWLTSSTHPSFPTPFIWPAAGTAPLRYAHLSNEERLPSDDSMPEQLSSPPTLQNPENVVRSSDTSRYEKHFIPNVALQQQADMEADCDMRKGDSSEVERNPNKKSEDFDSKQSVGRQLCVLDCLCHLESIFMKVLDTSPVSNTDRDSLTEKYISYSDSIRKCVLSPDFADS